jgi:hypothetical protein
MKAEMKMMTGTIIILLAVLLLQGSGSERYRLIKNPNPEMAVSYRQARYLKIQVNRPDREPARIKILLNLVELFAEEKIELDGGTDLYLGEIINLLRDRGRSWMVELEDPDEEGNAWIWFER